jgi:hypothetical protein
VKGCTGGCLCKSDARLSYALEPDCKTTSVGKKLKGHANWRGELKCWSSQVAQALRDLGEKAGVEGQWAETMLSGSGVDPAAIGGQLHQEYQVKPWSNLAENVRQEGIEKRKTATYNAWFRAEGWDAPGKEYQKMERPRKAKVVARFRLGCCPLRVEEGRREGIDWAMRSCTRCSQEHIAGLDCAVDDEYHLIFDCETTADLREEHWDLFEGEGSLILFMQRGQASRDFIVEATARITID